MILEEVKQLFARQETRAGAVEPRERRIGFKAWKPRDDLSLSFNALFLLRDGEHQIRD